jgi:DNA-binding Lrp family transcriptional regulator
VDSTDQKILKLLQEDFPLTERPFRDAGDLVGCSEEEVMARVRRLTEAGVIRRIGAVLDAGALGFVTTLCATRVPEKEIDLFAKTVNALDRVTHNYLRDGHYNIWFTLWGKDVEEIEGMVEEIIQKTGVREISCFPARKTYKVRAVFDPPVTDEL